MLHTGRSVVWLARLLWEQEAVSSNLTVPTIFFATNIMLELIKIRFCFYEMY